MRPVHFQLSLAIVFDKNMIYCHSYHPPNFPGNPKDQLVYTVKFTAAAVRRKICIKEANNVQDI